MSSIAAGSRPGGNGALICALAKLVVAGISERQGYRVIIMRHFKVGFLFNTGILINLHPISIAHVFDLDDFAGQVRRRIICL